MILLSGYSCHMPIGTKVLGGLALLSSPWPFIVSPASLTNLEGDSRKAWLVAGCQAVTAGWEI